MIPTYSKIEIILLELLIHFMIVSMINFIFQLEVCFLDEVAFKLMKKKADHSLKCEWALSALLKV